MANGIAFWVLMAFLVFFGGWPVYTGAPNSRAQIGFGLVLLALLALLGWAVFGPALKG